MSDEPREDDEPQDEVSVPTDPPAPALDHRRSYHVGLTATEVLARLGAQPGVKAYDRQTLPDFGGLIEDADYTLELDGEHGFRLHCGPPAARGQSATGMLRLLYLQGVLTPTEDGTRVDLRFVYRRPTWALQRWVGFLALASLGLLWVLVAPGVIAKKALLYGALLLVLIPVVVHDLRRDERLGQQKLALLNLLEHTLGTEEIDGSERDALYRKALRPPQTLT